MRVTQSASPIASPFLLTLPAWDWFRFLEGSGEALLPDTLVNMLYYSHRRTYHLMKRESGRGKDLAHCQWDEMFDYHLWDLTEAQRCLSPSTLPIIAHSIPDASSLKFNVPKEHHPLAIDLSLALRVIESGHTLPLGFLLYFLGTLSTSLTELPPSLRSYVQRWATKSPSPPTGRALDLSSLFHIDIHTEIGESAPQPFHLMYLLLETAVTQTPSLWNEGALWAPFFRLRRSRLKEVAIELVETGIRGNRDLRLSFFHSKV